MTWMITLSDLSFHQQAQWEVKPPIPKGIPKFLLLSCWQQAPRMPHRMASFTSPEKSKRCLADNAPHTECKAWGLSVHLLH